MQLTITLDDQLAANVEKRAEKSQLPITDWVMSLIAREAEISNETEAWEKLNARRFTLIEKRYRGSLSEEESQELEKLQQSVDLALQPWDDELLEQLKPLEEAVSGLK